ncbi:MAG: hypothetical protein E7593_00110 [Ruminococcaceae bacterium]|nr:hypothetical protein [Oscillospiraceae bacterium]
MKRFYVFMSMAMIVIVIAAMSVMTFTTASAATTEVYDNVVFVSDTQPSGSDGSGSSPKNPLKPYTPSASLIDEKTATNSYGNKYGRYYYKTALYQAAEQLVDTGGTIVICGPVLIDAYSSYGSGDWHRDFILPESDKPIVITSKYGQYDFTSSAYLEIKTPAHITLGAPTEFNNMKISIPSGSTNRAICANGNKIVMGENLNTGSSTTTANNLLSIAGGTRYESFEGNSDITIKSGVYNNICGTTYSAISGNYTNDMNVKISIQGTTRVRGNVCGGDIYNSSQSTPNTLNGNIQIDIHSGTIEKPIYITGKGGFSTTGNIVKVNIYGGTFTTTSAIVKEHESNVNKSAYKIYLNLSKTGLTDTLVNNFINNAPATTDITYPASWISECDWVIVPKSPSFVLNGKQPTAEGAKLSVKYNNNKTKTIEYSPEDKAFSAICDTSTVGSKSVTYKYGDYSCTGTVNVIDFSVKGAKIKTESDGNTQGLRFVVNYSGNLPTGMTIAERGVIAVQSDILNDESKLDFDQTVGMEILTIGDTDYNTASQYSCTIEDIPLNRFKIDYVARAYLKITYNNETFYVYSDPIRRNPYKIAQQAAAENSDESSDTRTYLNNNVISKFNNYNANQAYVDAKSIAALRQQVVDYMRAQMNITWIPNENFLIYNDPDTSGGGVTTTLYFKKGQTYTGIPYTNNKSSQKESFEKFIENGTFNVTSAGVVKYSGNYYYSHNNTNKTLGYQNYLNFPGSDCSTSVVTSWNTIINNRSSLLSVVIGTRDMIPGGSQNTITVGNYTCFDEDGNAYVYTTDILERNGKDAIYAAYDQLQPGDATVYYKSNTQYGIYGHMRMVSEVYDPNNPDCRVDENEVMVIECINDPTLYNCWEEKIYTYEKLYSEGSIPITIPELVTGHSDEETTIVTDLSLDTDLSNGVLSGKVKSNRQIVYLEVEVKNGDNTQPVYYKVQKSTKWKTTFASEVDLSEIDMSKITLTPGTEYTFTLKVCLPGEVITPIKNYTFTAN